jgi:hypothetical protein
MDSAIGTRRCLHCRKPMTIILHASTLLCSPECRSAHLHRYQAAYRDRAKQQPPKEQDHGRATAPTRPVF